MSAAKAAGAVAAGGVLLVAVSALSKPEEAEPLPADVGLASGATGAYGYASALVQRPEHAQAGRSQPPARGRGAPGLQARPRREHEGHPVDRSGDDHGPREPASPDEAPAPPPPLPAPAAPPVAPSPPPPSVATPPVPVAEPADTDHHPSQPEPPARPAQFGFER